LGLQDVADFNIEERVLGLPKNLDNALVEMKVTDFVDEVSRESPAPGGGSIAALSGALGAALSSMVSNLSSNKRGSEGIDKILNELSDKCQAIKFNLIRAVDEDTNAFNAYMDARRLPSKTGEQKQIRKTAMQKGLKQAVSVPLNTAKLSFEAIKIANTVAKYGNPNSITDVGVGAQCAYTGVIGGIYNMLINLKDIEDKQFVENIKKECADLKKQSSDELNKVLEFVESKL